MIGDDLNVFFEDFAVPVSAGQISGKGILDAPTLRLGDADVLSNEYLLTVRAAEFGDLTYGNRITVDGALYSVREVRAVDDGKLAEISLSKV